jgi:sulfur-oxidizing protein SoxX
MEGIVMFIRTILGKPGCCSILLLTVLMLSACDEQNQPVRGFVLPQGDIDAGKQVFIDHGCYQCHTLANVELPERVSNPPVTLEIGGKVYRVRNYGELLDSIVNPDHIISAKYRMALKKDESEDASTPMPSFNEELTVVELIDLVAFLHDQYIKMDPPGYQDYGFR